MDVKTKFFEDYKKYLICALLAVVLGSILTIRLSGSGQRKEAEILSAYHHFSEWTSDNGGFDELTKIIKKHPELHAKYDHQILKNLLITHMPREAKTFQERGAKRVGSSNYQEYARTSLLIAEENFKGALDKARSLKMQMAAESEGNTLFAFNLFRIATLCQKVGDTAGEKAAWDELKGYEGREGFEALLTHFSVQETTLLDYIASREEQL